MPATNKGLPKWAMGRKIWRFNSKSAKKLLQDEYFSYNLKYGDEKNYPGMDYALNWHKRNMRIYNNILRELDYKNDETILVVFAGSQIKKPKQLTSGCKFNISNSVLLLC